MSWSEKMATLSFEGSSTGVRGQTAPEDGFGALKNHVKMSTDSGESVSDPGPDAQVSSGATSGGTTLGNSIPVLVCCSLATDARLGMPSPPRGMLKRSVRPGKSVSDFGVNERGPRVSGVAAKAGARGRSREAPARAGPSAAASRASLRTRRGERDDRGAFVSKRGDVESSRSLKAESPSRLRRSSLRDARSPSWRPSRRPLRRESRRPRRSSR
ncbi:hypothetical protein CC85DRAFT_8820 [Cutaneotrichosporon oleaginosum]|uniref:Uncharacterized protein n=1 Tax=Cutaneotrichosporon oleaginosum TaxID=879819 RepID=A0A0J0XU27_9TREE|nr:uncharacterized protein CC85DRAFT_8820 [Cutaneotrichosporon oleaginosum]KLT44557.1 hypothetical protein CC85DRAFT_8820 [Cutaneotrichosporon oleaginosum]TXT13929.1 hypothetical protein COLE_00122 [Cutaneotrichosporon oleaginosum]